jgi:hypothetical protein
MDTRVKTGLWVRAQVRLCDIAGRPAMILRHGDDDAGVVILKLIGADGAVRLLAQTTAPEGGLAWHRPLGAAPVAEADAEAYIARQAGYDPDIWVLEILDRDQGFVLDGRILKGD